MLENVPINIVVKCTGCCEILELASSALPPLASWAISVHISIVVKVCCHDRNGSPAKYSKQVLLMAPGFSEKRPAAG